MPRQYRSQFTEELVRTRTWMAAVLFILTLSSLSPASTIFQIHFDEMVRAAELAFEGRVIDQRAGFGPNGRIYTFVTFEVLDVIKGTHSGSKITLRYLGGTVGEDTLEISDLVLPRPNERGIYFVESLTRRLINPLYGWDQGRFIVKAGCGETGCVLASNSRPVVEFDRQNVKANRFSSGVAAGLKVAESDRAQGGMSAASFKRRIRGLSR
jgi:hypothetical protein